MTRKQRIVRAAERLVGAKDLERVLVQGMKHCERHPYIVGEDDEGCFVYSEPAERNEGGEMCSRAMIDDPMRCGPEEPYRRLDAEEWCQSCRDNLPAVEELRRVRRSMGGGSYSEAT